nr:lysine 2,3-aminomutase [Pseudomonadota bacterium]
MKSKQSTIRSLDRLAEDLLLARPTQDLHRVAEQFAVAITPAIRSLIDRNAPFDPIAAQFVPSKAELTVGADEVADPISDEAFSPVKGIVHRYPDRALLKLTLSCPVHCRFCFRREQLDTPGGTLA